VISVHSGHIAAKNLARDLLAVQMAEFFSRDRSAQDAGGVSVRQGIDTQFNRGDLFLPGSKQSQSAADQWVANQLPGLIEKGAGISAISIHLGMSTPKIKRIAAAFCITIPAVRAVQVLTPAAYSAQKTARDAARAKPLALARELAATGHTIEEMAAATGKSRKTIIIWLRKYNVVRGPKMNLSA
jgi:hypothetical protein